MQAIVSDDATPISMDQQTTEIDSIRNWMMCPIQVTPQSRL